MSKRLCSLLAFSVLLMWSMLASAEHGGAQVFINGQQLRATEVATLEAQLGTRITPGYYAVNFQNGCWTNLSTGASGCLGGSSNSYASRYGSGERNAQGDWSHWSDLAGGGVGGTGDGCYYAFGWSNC